MFGNARGRRGRAGVGGQQEVGRRTVREEEEEGRDRLVLLMYYVDEDRYLPVCRRYVMYIHYLCTCTVPTYIH